MTVASSKPQPRSPAAGPFRRVESFWITPSDTPAWRTIIEADLVYFSFFVFFVYSTAVVTTDVGPRWCLPTCMQFNLQSSTMALSKKTIYCMKKIINKLYIYIYMYGVYCISKHIPGTVYSVPPVFIIQDEYLLTVSLGKRLHTMVVAC